MNADFTEIRLETEFIEAWESNLASDCVSNSSKFGMPGRVKDIFRDMVRNRPRLTNDVSSIFSLFPSISSIRLSKFSSFILFSCLSASTRFFLKGLKRPGAKNQRKKTFFKHFPVSHLGILFC